MASEGLIEILPNRGATVAPLTIEDLQEVVDVLSGLEAVVGRLAAEKIDAGRVQKLEALHRAMLKHHRQHDLPAYFRVNQQIHLALVEATGNRTLLDTYTALNLRIRRFRYLADLASDRWAQAVSEHEGDRAGPRRRDGNALGALLQTHLRTKIQHVTQSLLQQRSVIDALAPPAAE